MRMIYKLKACESKSITSSILKLKNCTLIKNNEKEHASLRLQQTKDSLLVEALNQITPVYCRISFHEQTIYTNESRYIWKLNPELKSNKIRLQLLRQLKPLGIFFTIRNTNSNIYLKLNSIEFSTFQKKWNVEYPNLNYKFEKDNDNYLIFFNNFDSIVKIVIEKYIIKNSNEREFISKRINEETLDKLQTLKI